MSKCATENLVVCKCAEGLKPRRNEEHKADMKTSDDMIFWIYHLLMFLRGHVKNAIAVCVVSSVDHELVTRQNC